MVDEWSGRPPQSNEFPRTDIDGIKALIARLTGLATDLRESTSNLLRTAGIYVAKTGMRIASSLLVEGDLVSTGNATINGTMDVYGRVNVHNEAGFAALYADGKSAAKFGPLRSEDTGESTGYGLLVQAPAESDGADVFKAKVDPSGNRQVFAGSSVHPLDDFGARAKYLYLESTAPGTGDGASLGIHSAGDLRLSSANYTLLIPWATNSASANMYLDAGGRIWKSSSARRFKQDIEDAEVSVDAVLKMRPRTWRDRAEVERDPEVTTRYIGFIAEELEDVGLGQFVTYDGSGAVEGIAYDRLTAAILPVLVSLDQRVKELEQSIKRAE